MSGAKVRVLVAEDSLTVRRRICEVLEADGRFDIVGEAEDGKRAIDLCRGLRPDVITMDMVMPLMSGLSATELIMAHCPTPILVVSGSENRGELFKTYDALAAGAVDVLEKPGGDETPGVWEQHLCSAVGMVARIKVITHLRGRIAVAEESRPPGPSAEAARAPTSPRVAGGQVSVARRVLCIGASTGGPGAVATVLTSMSAPLPVPVLLVLHIDEPFGRALAQWLDAQTGHRVRYPTPGERLADAAGTVLMAPPGRHMAVRGGRVLLDDDAPRHSCKPSVDVLFESVAGAVGPGAVGCLLTGMGKDGALGMLALDRRGAATVAQDEATSVVYGMPREAVILGAAQRVLPLHHIGAALAALVGGQAQGRAEARR
ncbi:MAG: chemotaxis-specific protein-glutamate methyltransferase CheB [Polyangiaceae bacterium]